MANKQKGSSQSRSLELGRPVSTLTVGALMTDWFPSTPKQKGSKKTLISKKRVKVSKEKVSVRGKQSKKGNLFGRLKTFFETLFHRKPAVKAKSRRGERHQLKDRKVAGRVKAPKQRGVKVSHFTGLPTRISASRRRPSALYRICLGDWD